MELILLISRHLAPCEAAALSLTCRRLYYQASESWLWEGLRARKVRTRCVEPDYHIAPNEPERWQLLQMLDRDSVEYELCHFCRILHPLPGPDAEPAPVRASFPFAKVAKGQCSWQELAGPCWWNLGKLTFRDVNRIMQKRQPLSSLSISTDWTKHPTLSSGSREGWQDRYFRIRYIKLDTEAAVVNGDLLLHTVQRLWMPADKGVELGYFTGRGPNNRYHGFQVCRHDPGYMPYSYHDSKTGFGYQVDHKLGQLWQAMSHRRAPLWRKLRRWWKREHLWSWIAELVPAGESRWRCPFCPTRAKLKTYDHKGRGIEAVLDTWQNLGTCQSLQDSEWSLCWQPHCMAITGHVCSIPPAAVFESAEANAKMQKWLLLGKEVPEQGSWCVLPAGETGLGHPSADPDLWMQLGPDGQPQARHRCARLSDCMFWLAACMQGATHDRPPRIKENPDGITTCPKQLPGRTRAKLRR